MKLFSSQQDYYRIELPWCLEPTGELDHTTNGTRVAVTQTKKSFSFNEEGALEDSADSNSLIATIISIFKFASVSGTIFIIGFLSINWQAYSQIVNFWLMETSGKSIQADIISTEAQTQEKLLRISKNTQEQKKEIPLLELAVTPPDTRILIPRIGKNVPLVPVNPEKLIKRDWNGLEKDIQTALRDGVIHYPGTAWPGEEGNMFITGHSSYYPWDPGRFKDVFALLHEIKVDDEIVVFYKQKKFVYKIDVIKTVKPEQVDVLTQSKGQFRITLMTCTPVGTNINRLTASGHLVR